MADYKLTLDFGGGQLAEIGSKNDEDIVCCHENAAGQKFTGLMVKVKDLAIGDKICYEKAMNPNNPHHPNAVPGTVTGKDVLS